MSTESTEPAALSAVLGRLPHRHPFILVDRICALDDEGVEGSLTVRPRLRSAAGLPPMLLCEALAQLSKVFEVARDPDAAGISFLASVQVEFSCPGPIAEEIRLFARRLKTFQAMTSYRVRATSGAVTLLEGVLTRRLHAA